MFSFVLMCNLLGMFPYFFTTTSHIAVTGVLALIVFGLVTLLGIFKNGVGFMRLFAPAGVPFYAWKRLRFSHAIWHLFVLAGSTCHFFAVFLYVIPGAPAL